jgi:hypothetical protein
MPPERGWWALIESDLLEAMVFDVDRTIAIGFEHI